MSELTIINLLTEVKRKNLKIKVYKEEEEEQQQLERENKIRTNE